jgi:thiol:disulfide interchange protein
VVRDGDRVVIESAGKTRARSAACSRRAAGLRAVDAAPGTVAAAASGRDGGATGYGSRCSPLLGAVLGGLILNIMPCVFPILSLKALSLAKAGRRRAAIRAARRWPIPRA